LRITFLGTGTSHGVPMIGCRCDVCLSTDPRDKRLRPSVFITLDDGTAILIDTSAEFKQTEGGHEYVPRLRPFLVEGPFCARGSSANGDSASMTIVPVPILHGARSILGYRLGTFAYLTDCSGIPDASYALLAGVELLVIGALRDKPHPSHFTVSEAIDAATRIGASRVFFTHMNHDLGHVATCARLPAGIQLAYDGLVVRTAE
jgi:phosphoribosyl 1,2-cyclic phosphate phosphodiesterase